MATVVDSLFITLGMKTADVDKSMKRVQDKVRSGVRRLVGFFAPLAGALSFGALASSFWSTAGAVDALSRQVDINVEALQQWQGAARQAGVSAQNFDAFIQKIGADVRGTGRTVEGELGGLVDRFAGLSDLEAVRLGDSLQIPADVVDLLRRGRTELSGMLKDQLRQGVLRSRDIETYRRLRMGIDRLKNAFVSLSGTLVSALGPAIEWVGDKITDVVDFLREHEPFTKAFFTGIALAITAVLIPALTSLGIAMLLNPLTWVFAIIAAAVTAVALLIDDMIVSLRGGKSLFDWKPWAEQMQKIWRRLQLIWKALKTIWDGATKAFSTLIRWVDRGKKAIDRFVDDVSNLFRDMWTKFEEDFPNLAAWAKDSARIIEEVLAPAIDGLAEKLDILPSWTDFLKSANPFSLFLFTDDNFTDRTKRFWGIDSDEALPPSVTGDTSNTDIRIEQNSTFNVVGEAADRAADRVLGLQGKLAKDTAVGVFNALRGRTATGVNQ